MAEHIRTIDKKFNSDKLLAELAPLSLPGLWIEWNGFKTLASAYRIKDSAADDPAQLTVHADGASFTPSEITSIDAMLYGHDGSFLDYLEAQDAGTPITEVSVTADGVATKAVDVQVLDGETNNPQGYPAVTVSLEASEALVPVDKDTEVVDLNGKATFTFGPASWCGVMTVEFKATGLTGTKLTVRFVK